MSSVKVKYTERNGDIFQTYQEGSLGVLIADHIMFDRDSEGDKCTRPSGESEYIAHGMLARLITRLAASSALSVDDLNFVIGGYNEVQEIVSCK